MKNVIAALQYAPHVSAAVQAIEATNASLPGATKRQLGMAAVLAVAKIGETVPEAHVALIGALIDIIVSTLNATGIFNHAPAAAVAAAK